MQHHSEHTSLLRFLQGGSQSGGIKPFVRFQELLANINFTMLVGRSGPRGITVQCFGRKLRNIALITEVCVVKALSMRY